MSAAVGTRVSSEGITVGSFEGSSVGTFDGFAVGLDFVEGLFVGNFEGSVFGLLGFCDGESDTSVGNEVGTFSSVGERVG